MYLGYTCTCTRPIQNNLKNILEFFINRYPIDFLTRNRDLDLLVHEDKNINIVYVNTITNQYCWNKQTVPTCTFLRIHASRSGIWKMQTFLFCKRHFYYTSGLLFWRLSFSPGSNGIFSDDIVLLQHLFFSNVK